jgi:hypothetical protein
MNYRRRRDQAQIEATAEHRRREDAAARLQDAVPLLESMRLTLEEVPTDGRTPSMPYVRPIVVASAPAHFGIRCLEPRCDGRHDLTQPILDGLRKSMTRFGGQSTCDGMLGEVPCDRTLSYLCEATYRK